MSLFSFFKREASNVSTAYHRSLDTIRFELTQLEQVAVRAEQVAAQRAEQIKALTVDAAEHNAIAASARDVVSGIEEHL